MALDDVYTLATAVENLKKLSAERNPTALPALLELKIPAVGLTSGTDALRAPLNSLLRAGAVGTMS